MKVAIAQPTYLPWLGYFDLMDQVDVFVLLDDVQFEKQSWQQRNRIKGPKGLQWLTIPVQIAGRSTQRISEVEIAEADFYVRHLNVIRSHYRGTNAFDRYCGEFAEAMAVSSETRRLCEVTTALIHWFKSTLDIATPLIRSSQLGVEGRRTRLNLAICQALGATEYYSAFGSAEYLLSELELFEQAGIRVHFQHYAHPEYKQQFPPFCSHASTLDLLFNEGSLSNSIVHSGRRTPFRPADLENLRRSESQQALHQSFAVISLP